MMILMAGSQLAAITVILILCSMGSRGQGLVDVKPRNIGLAVPGLFCEVDLWGQTNGIYGVKVVLGGRQVTEEWKGPDADARGMQVWLLQPDGTSFHPNCEPASLSSGRFGVAHEAMIFTFTRAPTNQVAGIVIRYRGKLYCKEIQQPAE